MLSTAVHASLRLVTDLLQRFYVKSASPKKVKAAFPFHRPSRLLTSILRALLSAQPSSSGSNRASSLLFENHVSLSVA